MIIFLKDDTVGDPLRSSHAGLLWPSKKDADLVERAEEKTLELDPNFADARWFLANIKWSRWDFRGTEEELRQVLALSPNNVNAHDDLGLLMATMGRRDEALKEVQIAQQLDPMGDHLRDALYNVGEVDRWFELTQGMLQSDPNNGFLHDGLYGVITRARGCTRKRARKQKR